MTTRRNAALVPTAEPLVSVVTPVYNGEPHLAECIESVLRQSYRNWEYVIVDNCSSDRTSEIAATYARKDSRVRYERHEEFVNAVSSHNRAIAAASNQSRYIKVVGADDWLYSDCLEWMVMLAEANPTVGIVSAYQQSGTLIDLVGPRHWGTVVSGHEVLRQSLLGGPYVTGSPTAVLYRGDVVRQREPFYDVTFRHADTEAVYWALTCYDFGLIPRVLTFSRLSGRTVTASRLYTHHPESLRLLLSYGPLVFAKPQYQRLVRKLLWELVWIHIKQRVKPSRRNDVAFHRYHLNEIALIRAQAPDATDVELIMALLQRLLRAQASDGVDVAHV